MSALILLFTSAFLIFACATFFKKIVLSTLKKTDKKNNINAYTTNGHLMTPTETFFFHHLIRAIDKKYHINCGVRLWNIISVKENYKNKKSAENRINKKEIDFIITDINNHKIIVAIELDDKSHYRADRIKRDIFVNNLFKEINIPLLRVPVQNSYNIKKLKEDIETMLLKTDPPAFH